MHSTLIHVHVHECSVVREISSSQTRQERTELAKLELELAREHVTTIDGGKFKNGSRVSITKI